MRRQVKLSSGGGIWRLGGEYPRYAAYGFFLLMCVLLQFTPRVLPTLAGGRPLLLIPAVVCIGMFTGPLVGGVYGIAAGLIWGIFSDALMGLHALYLLCIGSACGLLIQVLMRNNVLSALCFGVTATVVQGLGDWLLRFVLWNETGSGQWLLYRVLPNMVYTSVCVIPLYFLTLRIAKGLKQR